MWRWRDWVIDAFNRNLPFDRFTDRAARRRPAARRRRSTRRSPPASTATTAATPRAGSSPRSTRVEYVVDRVETTATVWLGLTLGCARCHDHKFDPITQREFYQLFAFFNNVPEKRPGGQVRQLAAVHQGPDAAQQDRRLEQLDRDRRASARSAAPGRRTRPQAAGSSRSTGRRPDWTPDDGAGCPSTLDRRSVADGERRPAAFAPGRVGERRRPRRRSSMRRRRRRRLRLRRPVLARRLGQAATGRRRHDPLADGSTSRGARATRVDLDDGKVQVNLVKRWLDDALRVETDRRGRAGPLAPRRRHLRRLAAGRRGEGLPRRREPKPIDVLLDELNQTFQTKEPLRIGGGGGPRSRFHGLIDDVRVYDRVLEPDEVEVLATARVDRRHRRRCRAAKRAAAEAGKLRASFLGRTAPAAIRRGPRGADAAPRSATRFVDAHPDDDGHGGDAEPRETHVLIRGQYDQPRREGDARRPGVPAARCPRGRSPTASASRGGSSIPDNPLTARVAVNRLWQMLFGTGLVKTVEDFGTQGEPPSPPRAARLAGDRVRPHRLGRQGDAQTDRHQRDLPPVVARHAGAARDATRRTACWPAARGSACRPR